MKNINEMMLDVLNERVEELNVNIKHYKSMKLNATNKRDEFRFGMMCAQYKDLLESTKDSIEHLESKIDKHKQLQKDIDNLLGKDIDEICFEDVQDLFVRILQGL